MQKLSDFELDGLREKIAEKKRAVEELGGTFSVHKEHGQKFIDKDGKNAMTGMGKEGIFAHGQKLYVYYSAEIPQKNEAVGFDNIKTEADLKKLTVPNLKLFLNAKGVDNAEGNKNELVEMAIKFLEE